MRSITVTMWVTLDGVVQGLGVVQHASDLGWAHPTRRQQDHHRAGSDPPLPVKGIHELVVLLVSPGPRSRAAHRLDRRPLRSGMRLREVTSSRVAVAEPAPKLLATRKANPRKK